MSKPSLSVLGAGVYSEYILMVPISSRALMSSTLLAELHLLAEISGDIGQQLRSCHTHSVEGPDVVSPGQSDLFKPEQGTFLLFKLCSVFRTRLSYCVVSSLSLRGRVCIYVCVCVWVGVRGSLSYGWGLCTWVWKPMFFWSVFFFRYITSGWI